jgi:hypothetical protein
MCGFLAGGDVYRYVIEVPAWRHLDPDSWLRYSKYADLNNGLFLFPFEAITGTLLLLIASAICLKKRLVNFSALSLYVSAILAMVGLVLTLFAAPVMLNLPKLEGNTERIYQAFNEFHFWGLLRAIIQTISFVFSAFALSSIDKLTIAHRSKFF